jgi:hypothetical protein
MNTRAAIGLGAIIILLISLLAGCFSEYGFVKNGIAPIGNSLYLVVTGTDNELVINTSTPGDLRLSQKTWKGKPRSEKEIISYNIHTKKITPLVKREKPAPGTVVIVFHPKYVKVYEGDMTKSSHKHRRSQD